MLVIQDMIKKGFTKLYKRMEYEELGAQRTKKYGFRTTPQTKPALIMQLGAACREAKIRIRSKVLLNEMSTFVQVSTKTGKSMRFEAISGCHDDAVMSLAMAWEMLRNIVDIQDSDIVMPESMHYDEDTGFLTTNDSYMSE